MHCYCPSCNQLVERAGDACAVCGRELRKSTGCEHFVSGGLPQEDTAPDLAPDTVLDRFTVIRRLGGSDAIGVYLARDAVRGEDTVLKVAAVGPCTAGTAARRLEQEMALHGWIADHRHVIRAHDLHFVATGASGLLVLSMEHAEGGTLEQWLAANRDDVERRHTEGFEYFKQLCCGVGSIHDCGIVHLDLKPENFLLDNRDLKIVDFGLALAAQVRGMPSGPATAWFPACPGTAPYMSPQQFVAGHPSDLDRRADLYALGIVLFEIWDPEGRPPFGGSHERVRELHLRAPVPALPGADPHVGRVVARCLQKDAADRYADVWDLLDDLEAGSNSEPAESSAPDDTWRRVCRCRDAGDLNGAIRGCGALLEEQADHVQARQLLEELQARYQEASAFYAALERDVESRNVPELLALLREAIQIFPDHPAGRLVQARVRNLAQAFRGHMQHGYEALMQGRWEIALDRLRQAQKLESGCPAPGRRHRVRDPAARTPPGSEGPHRSGDRPA